MGRLVAGAVLSVALVVGAGAGCSGDDDTSASGGARDRTTTTSADATTTTSDQTTPSTTSTTSASPPPASGDPGAPPQLPPSAAEAGGWRLVVDFPTAGGAVNASVAVCVEVSGTSREPVVALEATLLPPGDGNGKTVTMEAAVGRSALRADFSDQPMGPYDLHLQLVVDGSRVEGVAVTIPSVSIVESFVEITCE